MRHTQKKKEQRPLPNQSDPDGRCVESRGFIVTASRFWPLLPVVDGDLRASRPPCADIILVCKVSLKVVMIGTTGLLAR
jgi:hypothetical protein